MFIIANKAHLSIGIFLFFDQAALKERGKNIGYSKYIKRCLFNTGKSSFYLIASINIFGNWSYRVWEFSLPIWMENLVRRDASSASYIRLS